MHHPHLGLSSLVQKNAVFDAGSDQPEVLAEQEEGGELLGGTR